MWVGWWVLGGTYFMPQVRQGQRKHHVLKICALDPYPPRLSRRRFPFSLLSTHHFHSSYSNAACHTSNGQANALLFTTVGTLSLGLRGYEGGSLTGR